MTGRAQIKEDRELFAAALTEAFIRKYNEDSAEFSDTELTKAPTFSFDLLYRTTRARRRRRAAMLIAAILAVLMLCGCTVYVYREQLAGFLLEHTAIDIGVISQSAAASDTSPCFCLSYLPEGYELADNSVGFSQTLFRWKNKNGDTITLQQYSGNGASTFNNKGEAPARILHNGIEILHLNPAKDKHAYLWKDGEYILTITASFPLSDDELKKMIDGAVITEYISKP